MKQSNQHAFKEWSVVCAALAHGKQSLILRKGGIEDGAEGIKIETPEFWLYPTYLHQHSDRVTSEAADLPVPARNSGPVVQIRNYVVIERADFVATEVDLARLQKFHIWSPGTITERFHYRKPGLWALIVRLYTRAEAYEIRQDTSMAGCRTWVTLPQALSTEGLQPVLSDDEFKTVREAIQNQLG